MINRQDLLDFMAHSAYRPLTQQELQDYFKIESREMAEFVDLLNGMEEKGEIIFTRKRRYGLPEQMNLVVGRLQGHSRGFAFLIPDSANLRDVYIHGDDLAGAMHNDRVVVRLQKNIDPNKRQEGQVIRILERASTNIVGTFESSRFFGFVIPDDPRIGTDFFIAKEDFNGAKTGMKVVIEITKYPEKRRSPEGRVIEVLGYKGDPGVDIISIVKKHQLPEHFPEKVIRTALELPDTVSKAEMSGRKDLRGMNLITIDGEDAKDLDDAVSLDLLDNGGYRLGVHIADVGHYVPEGSVIDKEAFRRGTSIYLVDRVIPMLPEELSNGICSLNVGVDRLALSCFLEIDRRGNVLNHEITESVICVRERMTYTNVTKILEGEDRGLLDKYQDYVDTFMQMKELCLILRKKRIQRGAIDFDFPESKVFLDDEGKPIKIAWQERTIADQIIEEFMILANETISEHYFWMEIPFLYRVHEKPDNEDLEGLNNFLTIFGYFIKGNAIDIHPKSYQNIVEKIKGRPEERAISTVLLRSMKHARYAAEALGHFGLAAKYYSHFTAPIRRYPDLAIHRVIKELILLGNKPDKKRLKGLNYKMNQYAEQASLRERIAEEAERESVDLKKVEYMKQYEGEVFAGVISSVTSFGLFVALENSVEGLVHVSTMTDDFYQFIERNLSLWGEHTKKSYQLGQKVEVKITRVNVEERQIDFELV